MACGDDMKTLLSRYVDGELSADERARADEHIGACNPCRELLQIFQKNESLLSNALSTESFGNAVIESVLSEIKREEQPIEAKPVEDEATGWFRARPVLPLAAAALLVVGFGVVLSSSHNREVEKLQAQLLTLTAKIQTVNDLTSQTSRDYETTIARLRLEQAWQSAPERRIILGMIDPQHIIVKTNFDLKQFSSFELYRRGEGESNDKYKLISGPKRLDTPEHIDTDVKGGQAYVYKFRAYRSGKDTEGVDSFPHTMRVPRVQEVAGDRSIRVECFDLGANFKDAKLKLTRVVEGRNVTEEFFVKPGEHVGELREVPGMGKVDFRTNLTLDKLENGNQTMTIQYTRAMVDSNGTPIIKRIKDGIEEVETEQVEGVVSIRPNMRALFRLGTSATADVDIWKGSWKLVRALD
jgi:hypothetical protein